MEHIPFDEIEARWQARWEKDGVFKAPVHPKPGKKFYCLDMFPYPSAEGLHVGHPEGYTATDILSRTLRRQGWDVLHPMGWDAFGLPAENFAIQTGTHPREVTKRNVDNIRRQIKSLGFSYDWSREVDTTDPAYYRWTQWIFLQLFKKGLAYESDCPINWCPSCKTGLANEEVFGNCCERCGSPISQKRLRQWVLKITAYADRLADDLAGLDWPASTLAMQRHWIGRSEGAEIRFDLEKDPAPGEGAITVFTTRADTLFGVSWMVLAPEHSLVPKITTPEHTAAVEAYVKAAAAKSNLERAELQKDKTGVFTGAYVLHPVTGKKLPVWIADYVLLGYGTGAVMAVPGHDERDWEFAKKFGLDIPRVVVPADGSAVDTECFPEEGIAVNSDFLNGLPTAQAISRMNDHLEKAGKGKKAVSYKLRDWIFSRQRYWGEPIPLVHCSKCGLVPVPEEQLPVLLPDVKEYKPTGTGESPLAAIKDWVATKCPKCHGPGKRETNTMPQWAGSCWYYIRYLDPKNADAACSKDLAAEWLPVDCYIGGAEHAVLHLLYARFWHKVLFDIGLVPSPEPFQKLRHQGMILSYSHRDSTGVYHPYDRIRFGEDGAAFAADSGEKLESQVEKMSKSKKNVINPDTVLKSYGADGFRLYEMFMGPLEQSKPWDMRSIEGVARFLRKVWALVKETGGVKPGDPSRLVNLRHRTTKKVTDDIASFDFNTAISALMIYTNEIQKSVPPAREDLETLLSLLNPFAPHVTEELWAGLGHAECLSAAAWPAYDPAFLRETSVEYAVQVNGKLRATMTLPMDTPQDQVVAAALALDRIKAAVGDKKVAKTIVVPNKLVNIVVK
ncbi:MAG: leucine--tRNA ligase [Elusimicrobia bacterium]|nr:leucine--tRNA ligase [Elusimicrobiota bacterium]